MKYSRHTDLFINGMIPLFSGWMIYHMADGTPLNGWIKGHLPDGLWAYSFLSCHLIVWDRTVRISWVVITVLLSVSFELLQSIHAINGTGDVWDVVMYCLFFSLALFSNRFMEVKPK